MIKFKQGVKVFGLKPEIILVFPILDGIYAEYNTDVVITSGVDGKHRRGSLHFSGLAIDIRTRNLQEDAIPIVGAEIEDALTDEYDVVVESNHIHIEFQPKKGI